MRQDSTQEIRIPAPNGRPPAHLIRGIWGREYNSGRVAWFALRSDVRQAHKRQIFRAACMTLLDSPQEAAQALRNAAALRRLLYPRDFICHDARCGWTHGHVGPCVTLLEQEGQK